MSRLGISSIMAAALAMAGTSEPISEPPHRGPKVFRSPTRKARSKPPKPSKPLPEEYRANVRAQRGFVQSRIDVLRKSYRGEVAAAKRERRDPVTWAAWLNSHRRTVLELQFAGV